MAPTATAAAAAGTERADQLARACHSVQPAVGVDYHLLTTRSTTAAWLRWACQQRLPRRHARLVLYRVPAAVEHTLRRTLAGKDADLLLVPTLDDAALA